MKFSSFNKIFLIIGLFCMASPTLAQEAQPAALPACESETFDSMLYVVECAKEDCPYAKQQQGLYEMICAETNPGDMLHRQGFAALLDKVGGVEPLPTAKNIPSLAPCDCLAKLEEKFTCDIPTCAAPSAPQNGPQKTDTLPASEDAASSGCSLSHGQNASANLFSWAVMLCFGFAAAARGSRRLKSSIV